MVQSAGGKPQQQIIDRNASTGYVSLIHCLELQIVKVVYSLKPDSFSYPEKKEA